MPSDNSPTRAVTAADDEVVSFPSATYEFEYVLWVVGVVGVHGDYVFRPVGQGKDEAESVGDGGSESELRGSEKEENVAIFFLKPFHHLGSLIRT